MSNDQAKLEAAVVRAMMSYGRSGDLGRMDVNKLKEKQQATMFPGSKAQAKVMGYTRARVIKGVPSTDYGGDHDN